MIGGGQYLYKLFIDINTIKKDKEAELGSGAYGTVTKGVLPATSKRPEIHCAIKTLNHIDYSDTERKIFLNEIGCQAALHHIAILPIIGCSIPAEENDNYVIVTEFMKNGSLHKLIKKVESKKGPPNWETIRAINIFGIAAGMAYIHQSDVIHRDLKTDNIMLDENYNPKISDFGFSKFFEEGTQKQVNMTLNTGTPLYNAPEILQGEIYSNPVDIYAYSMVLYEILTLKMPYSDRKKESFYSDVLSGKRPTITKDIPKPFVELMNQCWDVNPEVRPPFIEIVKKLDEEKDKFFDFSKVDKKSFLDYVDKAKEGLRFNDLLERDHSSSSDGY